MAHAPAPGQLARNDVLRTGSGATLMHVEPVLTGFDELPRTPPQEPSRSPPVPGPATVPAKLPGEPQKPGQRPDDAPPPIHAKPQSREE